MADFRTLAKKFLYPPVWALFLLTAVSAVLLVLVFARGLDTHPVAYAVYVLAFYTLSVDVLACVFILPAWYRNTKKRLSETSLGGRYLSDVEWRARLSLYGSLAVNCAFAAVKFLSGLYYSSPWWGAIAFYYVLLSLVRFLLVRFMHQNDTSTENRISEYRRYRLTGVFFLLVYLSLSVILFMIVRQDMTYSYSQVITITLAAYTFYKVTSSIVSFVRYRKHKSPILSASKAIRLVAALVSMISLETAMLTTFGGEMPEETRDLFIILAGAAVSAVILTMAFHMIFRANREIERIRNESLQKSKR